MAGSDGSVDPFTGKRAYAYIVLHDGTKYSGSRSYEPPHNATSYQSELEGILGTIELVNEISIKDTDQICNNDAAVTIMNWDLTPNVVSNSSHRGPVGTRIVP